MLSFMHSIAYMHMQGKKKREKEKKKLGLLGQKVNHVMTENFVFLSNEDMLCCVSVAYVLMCILGKVTLFHGYFPFNMESLSLSGLQ